MSAQTISLRLPEEEVAILNLLSDRERRTKTQIIREALQPLFRKVLDEPERITLSNTEFQALLDEMATPPGEEVLARRRHLMTYERWKWPFILFPSHCLSTRTFHKML